jgi:hypothetical protein
METNITGQESEGYWLMYDEIPAAEIIEGRLIAAE